MGNNDYISYGNASTILPIGVMQKFRNTYNIKQLTHQDKHSIQRDIY